MTPFQPAELEHLRQALRTMALRKLGDSALAEDVAQETLLRVLNAVEQQRLDDPARIYGFVWGVANNVIAGIHRRKKRSALAEAWTRFTARPAADALTTLVSNEEQARVQSALQGLPPADRELLRLSFYEGLSPTELAERLGEPSTRLRKRKQRALERLRQAFMAASHQSADKATTSVHD